MENVHGVDVSWLHHSNKEHPHYRRAPSSPGLSRDIAPPTSSHGGLPHRGMATPPPKEPPPSADVDTPPATPTAAATSLSNVAARRPPLLGRKSSEKTGSLVPATPDSQKAPGSRRGSWISSLSSKFGSGQPQPNGTPAVNGAHVPETSIPVATPPPSTANEVKEVSGKPYVPQAPKGSNPGFLSSISRKFSSGQTTGTKTVPNGALCPRRVLNVDRNRDRCLVPELDQSKLRRVAFCVDVEIAGGPRYNDEADDAEKRQQKGKSQKLKERGEGEALKNPQTVAEEKEKSGVVQTSQEVVGTDAAPNPEGTIVGEDKKDSKKKDKKKRTEDEKRERKEKKRRKAQENGQMPLEYTRDQDETSSGTNTPRPQDRPTTDPLRIYRRCCQLRETPILKRITEQLARPSSCAIAFPGVVTCLDLTGSRLQLPDFVTLSDWLAIVPVKKLLLEDADMTNEAVRVVLAGLLAARPLDYTSRRTRPADSGEFKIEERSGIVQKLVLKNNPRITREGWQHISLFIYMCRSLKYLDVSMIHFPRTGLINTQSNNSSNGELDAKSGPPDAADILSKSLSERLGGNNLEELSMAECSLSSDVIRKIVDAAEICGVSKLSLAGNHLNEEGFEHVLRYIRSGVSQAIDLGANDLRNMLEPLAQALDVKNQLWGISLADCNLTPESLKLLLPVLARMPNMRFLDLSHNHELFKSKDNCMAMLRQYLPRFSTLKRLHLIDVDLSPAQAICLAEVLGDSPQLAHLNILENPQLSALASAKDEAAQEEACALYASLMAAVRVSHSIICIDIDVPKPDSNEIVKALAKQVVAYCLRNMEHFTAEDAPEAAEAVASLTEAQSGSKAFTVPDVILHLVGHVDDYPENHDNDEPAPDDDYIVGGTGVVRALQYCLSEKAKDIRRNSMPNSGTTTPRSQALQNEKAPPQAKQMSISLLDSARKVRARLQPAMIRESKSGNNMALKRLLFLDETLNGMIQRFEAEYPECRPQHPMPIDEEADGASLSPVASLNSTGPTSATRSGSISGSITNSISDDEHPEPSESSHPHQSSPARRPGFSTRQDSDVSLASRALVDEEGRMHRLGQRVRRDLLPPRGDDALHGTLDTDPPEPAHVAALRHKVEEMSGSELRDRVSKKGLEQTFKDIVGDGEALKRMEGEDPESFRGFWEERVQILGKEADEMAEKNKDGVAV
ncbi:RNI-like protein [Aulographum hederae CBS 113979]|uniref:RNI-like protein n=1 Tax=Aulographum hederae CBS 113979 TaxID=1176131 RepID=A0A6G1H0D2_9PEZI|nr:RNI-like protein [Aulographum hederae CBS 113979]